jgi:hypothetical protein
MDLWDVATVMWRRRGLTVPLLLLSAAAAVFALLTIPPAYSAKAQIAFLAPPAAQPGQAANPFTAAGFAEFLSIALNRLETRQEVGRGALPAEYRVTFKSDGLPLIGLEVVAPEREAVAITVDRLVRLVEAEAVKLQANVAPSQAITVSVADRGDDIRVVRSAGRRALVVIAGVGLIATAGVALAVDALIRRRSRGSEPPQRRLVPRQVTATSQPSWRVGTARLSDPEAAVAGSLAEGDAAPHDAAELEAAKPRAAAVAAVADRAEAGSEKKEPERATAVHEAEGESEASEPGDISPRLANAVTVLLDQGADGSGDNDVTVVLPLAGVSRPNGKQTKGPLGKRVSGDAPGGAKKR